MKVKISTIAGALLALCALTTAKAAFIVEADNVAPAGMANDHFFSTPPGTGFQLSATPSTAVGLIGNQSAFGNPANSTGPDRYEFVYTPGPDFDNTFFFTGQSLGNSSAIDSDGAGAGLPTYNIAPQISTGLNGGISGLYNVYFTVPASDNVNPAGSTITINSDAAPIVLNPVVMNSGATGPDEVAGGTFTGGANNRWLRLGTVPLTAGNTYSVVIEADAVPPDFVSQRAHGVMWEYAGPPPGIVLDNGSLRVEVSEINGAIDQVRFGGSDYYNPGTPVSNWGLQVDTDSGTFATNVTRQAGGSTGIPVSVASVGDTAVVTGNYAPGGGVDIDFTRTYSLVPGQNVLRITTEFFNNGVDTTISYFDTFDPDQGVDQGNDFSTFNDVFSVLHGAATVGQATELSGLSVAMGSLDGLETVASGSPFQISDGFTLNDFFSAPFDGNGGFADSGTHVGIRRFLAAGGSFTFTYDQAYGTSAAAALDEFIAANVPEPGTLMFASLGLLGFAFRRREKYIC